MNEHFLQLYPEIKEILLTAHFKRDVKKCDECAENIIDKDKLNHTEYHKFEETIDGVHIFRAKELGYHVVYAIDKKKRLIFLRGFKNFEKYKKFLADKRLIKEMASKI
jgi:mRNA-degrading endonuclease RelE of RelBE toxin-antitoxin system